MSTSCVAEYTTTQEIAEANSEEEDDPIYLGPAICSQESEADVTMSHEKTFDDIGAEIT